MKINRTYTVLTGILLLILIAVVFTYTKQAPVPTQSTSQTTPQVNNILLSVQGLYTNKQIEITSNETVLKVLQTLNAIDPQLQLSTKEYSGMGTLVVGIHGMMNGTNKKYWQYKVNGVMPQIGADQFKLKNGDSIEWFFGSSQE